MQTAGLGTLTTEGKLPRERSDFNHGFIVLGGINVRRSLITYIPEGGWEMMQENDDYEMLRLAMNKKTSAKLPKHKAVTELLKSIFSEEEVKLLRAFKTTGEPLSDEEISQLSGVPKDEVNKIFSDMAYKGKLLKIENSFIIMPLFPGLFEFYFTNNRDAPEKMKRAALAHRELFYAG